MGEVQEHYGTDVLLVACGCNNFGRLRLINVVEEALNWL